MYNWSTDEKNLRQDDKKYAIWKLEQMVNFGLNGKKISQTELRTYWGDLVLDPWRKKLLQLLLNT